MAWGAGSTKQWSGPASCQRPVTHPTGQARELGRSPPRAPLGPALHPKVLCHALSCGSRSLIPEFWEAWAEFPERVSQFSKQIGCSSSQLSRAASSSGGARGASCCQGHPGPTRSPAWGWPLHRQPGETEAQRGDGAYGRSHSRFRFKAQVASSWAVLTALCFDGQEMALKPPPHQVLAW